MNDPRNRENQEEANQDLQQAPQGREAQGGYNEGQEFNDFAEEDGQEDLGRRGGQRRQGGADDEQQEQDQDDTEAYDEQEEGEEEEGEDEGAGWVDRVTDIVTGQAEDVVYEKLVKYASIAIVGLWGLRRGGLLGGVIASAALGLAAKSLSGAQAEEEQPEEEMEAEAA